MNEKECIIFPITFDLYNRICRALTLSPKGKKVKGSLGVLNLPFSILRIEVSRRSVAVPLGPGVASKKSRGERSLFITLISLLPQ